MSGCIFCSIIKGQTPAVKVFENESVFAIMDIKPINVGHVLVLPKKHSPMLIDLDDEVAGEIFKASKRIGRALRNSKLNCKGLNFILNDGEEAGQEVFHAHLHIVPRYRGDGFGFKMPPKYGEAAEKEDLERAAGKIKVELQKLEG
ncbi:MAG: HIT family protein [Candidatus Bilamarchaeum sp.]|jgi:histidine triad (HIT) family protein